MNREEIKQALLYHRDIFEAWASGEEVEWEDQDGKWLSLESSYFYKDQNYRVKEELFHEEERRAFAEGFEIELEVGMPGTWVVEKNPIFFKDNNYRVKVVVVTEDTKLVNYCGKYFVVPDGMNWMTVSKAGTIYAHVEKPGAVKEGWISTGLTRWITLVTEGCPAWKYSLREI